MKLEVFGTPAPKGSSRAFMSRGPVPRAILAPSGSKQNAVNLKSWDQAVRFAANAYVAGRTDPLFIDVPLFVSVVFKVARPSGHWGKKGLKPSAPPYPATKPDLDKLVRSTMDSLKGTIYDDDSRIVSKVSAKIYASPGKEGASIIVMEVTPEILRHLGVPTA